MFLFQNMGIIYNTLYYVQTGSRQSSSYLTKGENSPAKNKIVSTIDVTLSNNLRHIGRDSGEEIKTLVNVPWEGYRILDYDRGNYKLLVEGPEGLVFSTNIDSSMGLLLDGNINKGVLQGKYCLGRKGPETIIISEDSDAYRNSIKLGDTNKPSTLSGGVDVRLVPGSVLIDHGGNVAIYLGKYECLDTRSQGRTIYTIVRSTRQMSFLYRTALNTVSATNSLVDYSNTIIENYSAMSAEEAFMVALYNSREFIPYMGEPEVYIEAQPTNKEHMLWPPTTRAVYPSLRSVYPVNGGRDGFEVTAGPLQSAEGNKILNYLVLRTGGLKRII